MFQLFHHGCDHCSRAELVHFRCQRRGIMLTEPSEVQLHQCCSLPFWRLRQLRDGLPTQDAGYHSLSVPSPSPDTRAHS